MPELPDTHLIIVDPDADFLAWAAAHLKAPGVSISTFERAEEALASYLKKRADLLLSEVRLNGTTGIELLKRLRQSDPQSMVILFSGTATTSHVIEAMRLGAYDVLGKERLPYELRTVVESALSSIEARRATPRPDRRSANGVHSGNDHRPLHPDAGSLQAHRPCFALRRPGHDHRRERLRQGTRRRSHP
jgi:DNA-binding NtrC family response regulator